MLELVQYFIIGVLSVLVLSKFQVTNFYMRAIYYGLALIFGGLAGGLASIPFGKSTNNHFRMFKIFQFMTRPLGLTYELRNEKILSDEKPYIIIANHQSALDVLGMSYAWPVNCIVMLKASLKYLPGFNLCAFLCESVYIERFSKVKAHQTVDATLQEIVSKKRKVWIYPEGTRNAEPELLPFKKGAFLLAKQANIPIVPCVFSSANFFYNFAEKRLTSGYSIIDILPEVDPSKFESIDELSQHCRDLMQKHRQKLDIEVAKYN
ncbi:unnamed protein product [Caenorhabditis angaria]|uniref:1-acyl-sn-glycerol-3-phosphate acyltransferase n=1 Tax=Caenorhabditis angaria TaxID=860376 RepID=A0A9P1ND74_9PELO|nr:unnamed protein product [Caenorhabditis angaria]